MAVVATFDSPLVLDCAVNPIPGSDGGLPYQVVSSLARNCSKIVIIDGIGNRVIGLYAGASGFESLVCQFGVNKPERSVSLQAGTRLSVRAMKPGSISTGELSIEFEG